jgi:hypothetical protein
LKVLTAFIIAFILFTPHFVSASPAHDTPVHGQLIKCYALFSKYFEEGNLAGIASLSAPGYVALSPGMPPVSRSAMLQDMKMQMSMLKNPVWKRTILRLSVGKGQALALVAGHMTATTSDRSHNLHAFVLNALTYDTWVRIDGKWEVLNSQVMKVQATIDGHSIQTQ